MDPTPTPGADADVARPLPPPRPVRPGPARPDLPSFPLGGFGFGALAMARGDEPPRRDRGGDRDTAEDDDGDEGVAGYIRPRRGHGRRKDDRWRVWLAAAAGLVTAFAALGVVASIARAFGHTGQTAGQNNAAQDARIARLERMAVNDSISVAGLTNARCLRLTQYERTITGLLRSCDGVPYMGPDPVLRPTSPEALP